MLDEDFKTRVKEFIDDDREAFLNTGKFKKLYKDYAENRLKDQWDWLLKIHEAGCIDYINNTDNLFECKQDLVKRLEDEKGLSPKVSSELLDMLILFLRNEKVPDPAKLTRPTLKKTILAFEDRTYLINENGTFVVLGENKDNINHNVKGWQNIITISASDDHIVGLKLDGTCVADGHNGDGQCDVDRWQDIVAISVGYSYTIGLKSDGTCVAVGYYKDGQCNVGKWHNIIAISTGYSHTIGLKSDRTVIAVGNNEEGQCDVGRWRDIVAVSAGFSHTVGLKSDGTVVVVGGNNDYGECNVESWRDIIAISAGQFHTVGLKSDGSVVAVGNNKNGQCDVEKLR